MLPTFRSLLEADFAGPCLEARLWGVSSHREPRAGGAGLSLQGELASEHSLP